MPGPRLEARTSNPQPIVVPNGPNTMQAVAGAVNTGLKLYSQFQAIEGAKDDNEALAGVQKEIDVIKTGVLNDTFSRTEGIQRVNAIVNKYKGNEETAHLFAEFGQMERSYNSDAGVSTVEANRQAVAKAKQEALKSAMEEYTSRSIKVGDERALNEALFLEAETARATRMNEHKQALGTLTSSDKENEGFATSATLFNQSYNQWNSLLGTSEDEFSKKTPEELSSILTSIDNTMLAARQQLDAAYGQHVSQEQIGVMIKPMEDQANFLRGLIKGENSFDIHESRNKLNKEMAAFQTARTPEEVSLNKLIDTLINGRNSEVVLNLLDTGGMLDSLRGQQNKIWQRLLGKNETASRSAIEALEDPVVRNKFSRHIIKAFGETDMPEELTGALNGTVSAMEMDINNFDAPTWDALLDFTNSKGVQKMKDNPAYASVLSNVERGLDKYQHALLSTAKKNLPEGAILSIENGMLTVTEEAPKRANTKAGAGIYNRDVPSAREIYGIKSQIDKWRQNYGTRINKLAQAGASLRGGVPQEHLGVIAAGFFPASASDNPKIEKAAQDLINIGLVDNLEEARRILADEF